jgi:hypothetical protein
MRVCGRGLEPYESLPDLSFRSSLAGLYPCCPLLTVTQADSSLIFITDINSVYSLVVSTCYYNGLISRDSSVSEVVTGGVRFLTGTGVDFYIHVVQRSRAQERYLSVPNTPSCPPPPRFSDKAFL